jgi:hypothetical protein
VFLFFIDSNFKKCNNFCQILTQELDFAIGTRPDTKLCQILGQELKALPGTRTSYLGTKLSSLKLIEYVLNINLFANFVSIFYFLARNDHRFTLLVG